MAVRVVPFVLVVALLAGCGGSSSPSRPAAKTTAAKPRAARPTDAQIRDGLGLPDRVPVRATGHARADDVRVLRQWLDRLRAGRVAAAASLFAVPSRFQNLSSLAIIRSRRDARLINASLPCGAKLVTAGGAGGYVVYRAQLTQRPGGACGTGAGNYARGAILVRRNHIVEWYRLPDPDPGRGGGRPQAPASGGPAEV